MFSVVWKQAHRACFHTTLNIKRAPQALTNDLSGSLNHDEMIDDIRRDILG
jgi:hypothetical protein